MGVAEDAHALSCSCGVRAVEDILKGSFGVDIRKALDPLNSGDYLTIVARLARAMSRATASTEAEILSKAVANLDVDWPSLSPAARSRVIAATRQAMTPIAAAVIPGVEQQLTIAGPRVVRGTRAATRGIVSAGFRSRIGVSMSERDSRIVEHMIGSQAHYIRDEYGRRVDSFSQRAREIVAGGVDQGLGRDEITDALVSSFGPQAGIARSRAYWNVVASTFASRSRTWGQLASYTDAGIERFVFEAVLDERTTDQCAAMHGRTFETAAAVQRYESVAAAEDPESVLDLQPWIRVGKDPQGRRIMYTQARDGTRTRIAEIVQSRVGTRDSAPQLRGMRSSGSLAEMGIMTPPLHGNCRSTIVPDV